MCEPTSTLGLALATIIGMFSGVPAILLVLAARRIKRKGSTIDGTYTVIRKEVV